MTITLTDAFSAAFGPRSGKPGWAVRATAPTPSRRAPAGTGMDILGDAVSRARPRPNPVPEGLSVIAQCLSIGLGGSSEDQPVPQGPQGRPNLGEPTIA